MSESIAALSRDDVQKALHHGELSVTLKASEDSWPHTLRDAGRTLTSLDRLLREVARSIDPQTPVLPVLVRVDLLDDLLRFTVRIDPPRPRKRKA